MALSNLLGISILYCFEWLTSLKIIFHKSEVFVFGGSQQERGNLANMLNCSLSSLPKSYTEGVLFISHNPRGRGYCHVVARKGLCNK